MPGDAGRVSGWLFKASLLLSVATARRYLSRAKGNKSVAVEHFAGFRAWLPHYGLAWGRHGAGGHLLQPCPSDMRHRRARVVWGEKEPPLCGACAHCADR
eukprot:295132-Chlamydomonas_euryale.AAC.1